MYYSMYYSNELRHHGILGQKWGIRRYQNKDGSLTNAGIKRYGTIANFNKIKKAEEKAIAESKKAKQKAIIDKDIARINKKYGIDKNESENKTKNTTQKKTKSLSEMSDDEVRSKINRIKLENELKSLSPKQVNKGKVFMEHVLDATVPAVKNAVRDNLEKYLKKTISDKLGLDTRTAEQTSQALQREAQDLRNRVEIANHRRTLDNINNNRVTPEETSQALQRRAQDLRNQVNIANYSRTLDNINNTSSQSNSSNNTNTSSQSNNRRNLRLNTTNNRPRFSYTRHR